MFIVLDVFLSQNRFFLIYYLPLLIYPNMTSSILLLFQLLEIVSAFGPLKAYHFEINEDLNEPCAFLEVVKHVIVPI